MDWKTYWLAIRFAARHPGLKLAAFGLVAGLIISLIAIANWIPSYQAHSEIEAKISAQRKLIYTNEQQKIITELYSNSKHSLLTLDKKLGANKSQSDYVKLLDKLLRNRRIKVVNETFETEQLQGGYIKLSQELSVQADYTALRKFLVDLDNLPTWTVVQELRIEKLHSYGSKIKAMLRMSTYRIGDK